MISASAEPAAEATPEATRANDPFSAGDHRDIDHRALLRLGPDCVKGNASGLGDQRGVPGMHRGVGRGGPVRADGRAGQNPPTADICPSARTQAGVPHEVRPVPWYHHGLPELQADMSPASVIMLIQRSGRRMASAQGAGGPRGWLVTDQGQAR
jgi:hypothetical protein